MCVFGGEGCGEGGVWREGGGETVAAQLNQQLKHRSLRLPLGASEARTEESSFCAGGSSGGRDVVLMCVCAIDVVLMCVCVCGEGGVGGRVAAQLNQQFKCHSLRLPLG